MARVSIVTPCYNGARFIVKTIQSVLDQTFVDWEHVIVDDCSADGSAFLAATAGGEDRRVRVIPSAVNQGRSAARNTGFAAIDPASEYVLFLDHDDLLKPDALERMVAVLDGQSVPLVLPGHVAPVVGSVIMEADNIDGDGNGCDPKYRSANFNDGFVYGFNDWLDGIGCFPPSRMLFRRWVCESVGGFDVSLPAIEDWDYFLRCALTSVTIFRSGIVTTYRNHDGQGTDAHEKNTLGWARIYERKVPAYKAAWAARGGRY